MASNQDARPFVDLQKDAEEFQIKFNEDIQKCKSFLDAKITSLICDPDSLGRAITGPKQTALLEFSKAKYDIFISVKSHVNEMEREWLKYISEMKKLFIENVEIFLAGTKLEVKLPSSEFESSTGLRKSPGNRKSVASSVTTSIYPIINSVTRNIPVIGGSLRRKEIQSKVSEETSAKSAYYNLAESSDSESSEDEARSSILQRGKAMDVEINEEVELGSKSSTSRKSTKLDSSDLNTFRSGSRQKTILKKKVLSSSPVLPPESRMSEDEAIHNNVKGRKSQSPGQNLRQNSHQVPQNSKAVSDIKEDVVEHEQNKSQLSSKGWRRKSRLAQNNKLNSNGILPKNVSSSENHETSESESVIDSSHLTSRGRGRRGKQSVQNIKSDNGILPKNVSISENHVTNESESDSSDLTARGRGHRGKQSVQNIKSDRDSSHVTFRKPTSRTSTRSKSAAVSKKNSNSTSDESEEMKEIETSNDVVALKGHRGKQSAKNKINATAVQAQNEITGDTKAVIEEEPNKNKTARTSARTSRKSVIERVIESGPSRSPNKIAFTAEGDINDIDISIPVARPTKSSVRRKTLLPNLEEDLSGDMIPGNSRARSKRKTISGVSEITSVAPSKRLKAGTQKSISAAQGEVMDAADNLLGSDEDYSEWMALKSVDGKIPICPAVYEVKVWRAKKSAYIGCCESLRQKLTLHKLRQNSGHKQLDKFIERNYNDIQIRFEVMSSMNNAKAEVKNRINSFVAQHKTTPAYN